MVECSILPTFNITIVEVCNLEIYIAYVMAIKLFFQYLISTYSYFLWRHFVYFYNGEVDNLDTSLMLLL